MHTTAKLIQKCLGYDDLTDGSGSKMKIICLPADYQPTDKAVEYAKYLYYCESFFQDQGIIGKILL